MLKGPLLHGVYLGDTDVQRSKELEAEGVRGLLQLVLQVGRLVLHGARLTKPAGMGNGLRLLARSARLVGVCKWDGC